MEGFHHTRPAIKSIDFRRKGCITLHFKDGRILSAPLSKFPSLKKLTPYQRRFYQIADEQVLIFRDCDEVYHVQDFFGRELDYKYSFVSAKRA